MSESHGRPDSGSSQTRVGEPPSIPTRVGEPPSIPTRVGEPPSIPTRVGEPPSIEREEVERIARLCHLDLGAEDLERMTRELDGILGYVRLLQELDVSAVPPTAHVQIERLPLRADEPVPSLPVELALREAPRAVDGGFAVPAFVDEG